MSTAAAKLDLHGLIDNPFELLKAIEQRCLEVTAGQSAEDADGAEWVGIGFRIGNENMLVQRDEVREVMIVPEQMSRVPGAKSWISGLANLRGQLLSVVDLRSFLGAGTTQNSRAARVLVLNSREFPVGILVDEVFGFRRFLESEFSEEPPQLVLRCERYLDGVFEHSDARWPVFSMSKLLANQDFQHAGDQ